MLLPGVNGFAEEYLAAGAFDALRDALEEGSIQFFCTACDYNGGWFNRELPPRDRVLRHNRYERYLIEEVLPLVRGLTGKPLAHVMGCGFGAFLATTFALKHPDLVEQAASLSGNFSIQPLLDGYYDEDCYYNSPLDFVPNIEDEQLLARLRRLNITLICGESEMCVGDNRRLAAILAEKRIPSRLIVASDRESGWELWKKRFADLSFTSAEMEERI